MADASRNQDETARRLAQLIASEPLLAFLHEVHHQGDGEEGAAKEEWFLVGGAVRDAVIGRKTKDFDLLVRNVPLDAVADRLSHLGDVNLVGKRFGVLKFKPRGRHHEIDIASPRTEKALGDSGRYRDFSVHSDPRLPLEADLLRRDFTMNAVAWDIRRGKFVDPHGGLADIANKTIRAVGAPETRFTEDLSRMLRAVRFACQLGFRVEPETWRAVTRLAHRVNEELPLDRPGQEPERRVPHETVARELARAFAADPAQAAALLEDAGLLFALIPELRPLRGCAQSPDHHSEGDVWAHTSKALAELNGPRVAALFGAEAPGAENDLAMHGHADATTAFAVLLHDVAKPRTSAPGKEGRITFYGHAELGAEIAREVAARLRLSAGGVDEARLEWLVKMHLVPNMLDLAQVRRTTLEKHFLRDRAAGRQLLRVAAADAAGSVREDGADSLGEMRELLKALAEIEAKGAATDRPRSLVTGEEVMAATGMEAGPQIGALLDELREAQLRGEVATHEDAKAFIKKKTPV